MHCKHWLVSSVSSLSRAGPSFRGFPGRRLFLLLSKVYSIREIITNVGTYKKLKQTLGQRCGDVLAQAFGEMYGMTYEHACHVTMQKEYVLPLCMHTSS